jgi:hypothetical protein
MTADDYQNILRGETQDIRDSIVTADDYNRLLSGQGDRIVEAVNQGRMTADDYQNILRGETQDIRDSIVTADDYNRLLSGTEDRITSAISQGRMTADDYQNILRGETQSIREAIDADRVTADDYARILGGELTARDERQAQERQAKEAAEAQERAAKQAIEDRMNLQFNDRLAETLGSRRPISQIRTADDYRNVSTGQTPFEPSQILRRPDVVTSVDTADDYQRILGGERFEGELPDISNLQQRAPSDPALESQLRAQFDMQAQQGDGGLRTFAASPQFNPNAAGLENLARRQDAGLETFAARGSRYNRGAEQLRRQAGQRPSGTLQDRLEQAYMGRIDAANDPILASQIADQQLRQQEAQQGLVEQLSRYGVLRGGGDTAAALTRMSEGNERNRLALEAAAAQRRQGDLRDASAFDQARSSMDIAQRGQSLEERIGADRLLDTALARDVTRAGQTGQFQGVDTLAAQEQRQRMNLAEREQDLREDIGTQDIATSELGRDVTRASLTGQFQDQDTLAAQLQAQQMDLADAANRRADIAQQAGLTGEIAGEGSAPAITTLAGRELALREDLARAEDLRAQQAAESALFGQVTTGTEAPIETIQGQRALSDLDSAALAREATEAGLTGRFDGALTADERDRDLARRISEAGVTGRFGDQDTIQSQVIESSLQNEALNRGLARAGATGQFREEGDTGAGTETLESRLRTAGLTGELGGQLTLGGRQAEQDLIGSILAASDPELEGRTDALAEALTGRLGIEERSRVEERFQDEIAELGEDLSFDDFYRLAEEYADYPSITNALEEMMAEQARKREEKEKEEEERLNRRGRGGADPAERNRINPRTGLPMV